MNPQATAKNHTILLDTEDVADLVSAIDAQSTLYWKASHSELNSPEYREHCKRVAMRLDAIRDKMSITQFIQFSTR